jgi:hypothetical protein
LEDDLEVVIRGLASATRSAGGYEFLVLLAGRMLGKPMAKKLGLAGATCSGCPETRQNSEWTSLVGPEGEFNQVHRRLKKRRRRTEAAAPSSASAPPETTVVEESLGRRALRWLTGMAGALLPTRGPDAAARRPSVGIGEAASATGGA